MSTPQRYRTGAYGAMVADDNGPWVQWSDVAPAPEPSPAKSSEELPVGWCKGGPTRPHYLNIEWWDQYVICTQCKSRLRYDTAANLARMFNRTPPEGWPERRLRKPVATR